jgi:hypothetical protein
MKNEGVSPRSIGEIPSPMPRKGHILRAKKFIYI